MRYMMFIKHSEDYRNTPIPQGLMDAMGEFVGANMKSGKLIDTAGLKATSEGRRVKLEGGKMSVVDGPFTESKEIIGGYALVEVGSRQEALDLAKQFMELHRVHWPEFDGECEVRALEDMGDLCCTPRRYFASYDTAAAASLSSPPPDLRPCQSSSFALAPRPS
jgi:hypothetical protein